jgi:hypothetical protein
VAGNVTELYSMRTGKTSLVLCTHFRTHGWNDSTIALRSSHPLTARTGIANTEMEFSSWMAILPARAVGVRSRVLRVHLSVMSK